VFKRVFGRQEEISHDRLNSVISKRLGEPIDRKAWDHSCPICGWPWRPTWHFNNDNRYALWSSCGACYAIAIDMLGWAQDSGEPVSMVTFFIAEKELAEWMKAELSGWPVYEIDDQPRVLDLPAYTGHRRLEDWDGRCPGCRGRWREELWVDDSGRRASVTSCPTCFSVMASRVVGREPDTYDLMEFVGFKWILDTPEIELMVGDPFPADRWTGWCPGCGAPMADPMDSDQVDDYGFAATWCPDCSVWASCLLGDGTAPAEIAFTTKSTSYAFDYGAAPG